MSKRFASVLVGRMDQIISSHLPIVPVVGEPSVFEAPVPPGTSNALSALVGVENSPESDAFDAKLVGGRLGVASSLYRALSLKHPATAKHCLRVALGCSVFANFLQLDDKSREQLEIAALLHDIGKLGVPDKILNKPGRLAPDEFEIMDRHLPFAVHIIESFCSDPTILDIVRYSGTWFDGSKPLGSEIAGEALPLGARILAIQNAFDAMTTDLVYRTALPRSEAISELFANSPTQFDPNLVTAFCKANNDSTSRFRSQMIRRWVEMSDESADQLWSLATPLHQDHGHQSVFQQQLLESMQDGVLFVDMSARIVVWNRGAEELTGLSKTSLTHSLWEPKVVDMRDMEGNAVPPHACPLLDCLINQEQSMQRLTISNRTRDDRVAVHMHAMPVWDNDGQMHGAIAILHDISPEHTLEERVQNLHTRATRDALTGVNNRAEFDRRHQDLVEIHSASKEPLGLVICDIDKFKSINDNYGHQAGDAALIEFASLIDQFSRGNDLVARYGGEEFVLLCPGCDAAAAWKKADDIRRKLAATPQSALNNAKMTASFGVTELREGDSPEKMLKRADEGLYEAKATGRNRVVLADDQDSSEKPLTSWFSWVTSQPSHQLLQRTLRCSVPVNVVTEKVKGFILDNSVEVISAEGGVIVLGLDESSFQTQRRQTDRPLSVTMKIELKQNPDAGNGTLIDVVISNRRGRDRRVEDMTERVELLLTRFKGYLIAEDY